jgi:hypothetical protein
MDRKQFLGGSLKAVAGVGAALGCPCVAAAALADEPPVAAPCPPAAPAYPHATTYEKRADFGKKWVGRFMRVLDERLDEKTRCGLMEANGRACAMGAYGPPDPAKTVPLEEFLTRVAQYVGPENCRREGNVVFFNYKQNPDGLRLADGYCLCPLVEDGPAGLSGTYCHCSVGYVAYLFEKNTGKPVSVELLESVRRGGKACRFKVTV